MFNLNYLVKTYNLTDFEKQIIAHEGMVLTPYKDTVGKLTIGVGWNIDDVPMRESEAIFRMRNDLSEVRHQVEKFTWFQRLNEVRQNVIIEMVFNLGLSRFLEFKKLIKAIEGAKWNNAVVEMLDSRWAKQVQGRATTLSSQMGNGE